MEDGNRGTIGTQACGNMYDNGEQNESFVARERFPFCLVWTPIPCLTLLLPFVGHMGIADSHGIIYDFAGSYSIGRDNMAFGAPTRFVPMFSESMKDSPERVDSWDAAIRSASQDYLTHTHNLIFDNCHSHVALALNVYQYAKFTYWNMMVLTMWMFFAGRFVSFQRFLYSVLPTLLFYASLLLILYFSL